MSNYFSAIKEILFFVVTIASVIVIVCGTMTLGYMIEDKTLSIIISLSYIPISLILVVKLVLLKTNSEFKTYEQEQKKLEDKQFDTDLKRLGFNKVS